MACERALITGATGFLGTRLTECLAVHEKIAVGVYIRNVSRAAMVGRYSVDMYIGELSDRSALARAAEGADVVFHLAHDSRRVESRAVNLEAAKNVADAAKNARLIYVSSAEVYGDGFFGRSGLLDERHPAKPTKNRAFAASKLEVEQYLESHANAAILQPTLIYGPYSESWVTAPLAALRTGWVALPHEGAGSMNAVFVDDVVQAMIAAARSDAKGRFLIAGPEPVTWSTYYERLEAMIGETRVTYAKTKRDFERVRWSAAKQAAVDLFSALSDHEVLVRAERIPYVDRGFDVARQRLPALWRSLKRTRDEPVGPNGTPAERSVRTPPPDARVHIPDAYREALYASNVRVSHERATRAFGYRPRFDFDTGMKVVEEFARWAYLL